MLGICTCNAHVHGSLCVYGCERVHVSVSVCVDFCVFAYVHFTSRLSALHVHVQNDPGCAVRTPTCFNHVNVSDGGTHGGVLNVHTGPFSRHAPLFFQRAHAPLPQHTTTHNTPHTHNTHTTSSTTKVNAWILQRHFAVLSPTRGLAFFLQISCPMWSLFLKLRRFPMPSGTTKQIIGHLIFSGRVQAWPPVASRSSSFINRLRCMGLGLKFADALPT